MCCQNRIFYSLNGFKKNQSILTRHICLWIWRYNKDIFALKNDMSIFQLKTLLWTTYRLLKRIYFYQCLLNGEKQPLVWYRYICHIQYKLIWTDFFFFHEYITSMCIHRHRTSKYRVNFLVLKLYPMPAVKKGCPILRQRYSIIVQDLNLFHSKRL